MKLKHPARYLICLAALPLSLCLTHCSNDKDCENDPEKDLLVYKDEYFPFKGNAVLKYLHNNADTQTFRTEDVQTFYVRENQAESGCPVEYESVRVRFKNVQSGDFLIVSYERDRTKFGDINGFNSYVFYNISYKGTTFNKLLYDYSSYKDTLNINGVTYRSLFIIGKDTVNNYAVLARGKGLPQVKIGGEEWKLIP